MARPTGASMPERIPALERRVARVEDAVDRMPDRVASGFTEVKDFIRQEIQDLKADHLSSIRATIERVERDLKGEHGRLADDLRRAWDAIRKLEDDRNREAGSRRATSSIGHTVTALLSGSGGGLVGWLLARLGGGPSH
jgi:Rad3-related DNA helicase